MRRLLKSLAAEAAPFMAGVLTTVGVLALAQLGCWALVITFIASMICALVAFRIPKSKMFSPKFKKTAVVTIIIAIFAMMSYGVYHKLACHKNVVEVPQEVSEIKEDVKEEEPQTPVEEETKTEDETIVAKKPANNRLTAEKRKECIDTQATKSSSQAAETGKEKFEGNGESNFISKPQATEPTEEEIKNAIEENADKAKEEGKDNVEHLGGTISAANTTEEKTEEKAEKEQPKNEATKVEIDSEAEEVKSSVKDEKEEKENNTEDKKENSTIIETKETTKVEPVTDDKLQDLVVKTEKEVVAPVDTTVTVKDIEKVEEKATSSITIEKVQATEEIIEKIEDAKNDEATQEKIEEPVVEEKPVIENKVEEQVAEQPITVEAVDGYSAYINSQIQFRVKGDNPVVSGLDGIEYSLNNGILTINLGEEATVLTVYVSNSTSMVNFDITVNGIVG
ncbi:MAG: hypothetical protein J6A15_09800 [Clostridia bacterium]|nr:hypothetical protein [Clostridia bacterium]